MTSINISSSNTNYSTNKQYNKHLLILDTNNLLVRSFFVGDKELKTGEKPIGAIQTLAIYINNLIRTLKATHIVMTRDLGRNTWRHNTYPTYKGNRPKADPLLYAQFPLVPVLCEYLEIPLVGHESFEADDCMATLAEQMSTDLDTKVTLVSTDKDLLQLLHHENVHMYSPHTKGFLDQKYIQTKYDVSVNQIRDFFALTGDACDNLPGVSGIGDKGAATILKQCGTLDNVFDYMHLYTKSIQQKLQTGKEQLDLMRRLVTLSNDVPLEFQIEQGVIKGQKDISIKTIQKILA